MTFTREKARGLYIGPRRRGNLAALPDAAEARYGGVMVYDDKIQTRWFIVFALLAACSSGGDGDPLVCEEFASSDFARESGWGPPGYCDTPNNLGCFPYHGSSADECGPFDTMRTSATSSHAVDACEVLMTSLNCATFESEDGTTRLSFHIAEADKLTMYVRGKHVGVPVDTVFHFNPCHQNCQAAITLETLAPTHQRVCDIPRQGKPVCLFPEEAHSLTFARADGGSVVMRMGGSEYVLDRVVD